MDVIQGISLTVVLLFALYGCARLIEQISRRLLRPREMRLRLLLPISGHIEDIEQHIRAAQDLAIHWRLPLYVVDVGADDETQRITALLLRGGGGELIGSDAVEKMWNTACKSEEMCV